MALKQQLYEFCQTFAENRILRIQNSIEDIQKSLTSETKSSAGDKHETGRAMLQLEREKLGQQLAQAESMKQVLDKVPLHSNADQVGLGSLVKTSKAWYYLGISAGECSIEGQSVFCISTQTPMAGVLLGKSSGERTKFNGEEIKIIKIL